MSEGDIGVEGPHLHTEEVDTQDHGQGHTHLVWEDRKIKFLKKENKAVKIENRYEDRIEMKIRITKFWMKEWGFEE